MVGMQYSKDPNALREFIGDIAKQLFTHFGFKKTSMDDVARKAQVAKGTIYNYFKNKDDLIRYVMRKEGETLISKIKEGILNQETPQLKFREMIIIKINFFKKELRLLFSATHKTTVEFLPVALEIFSVVEADVKEACRLELDIIEGILEEGVNGSLLRPIDIPATAKVLMHAIKGFELRWGIEMDIEQAIAELDSFLDIMFKGLEVR